MPKIVDEQTREATRRRIIREAAGEFARLGFDQANINTIAEQAGIGKGTIYLYFENKRELFLAMLRYIAQAHMAAIRAAIAADGTLEQRLKRLFLAFARLAAEENDSFNVFMSALYGVNRAFQAEATKLLRDYLAVIALMLEQSRAHGELQCDNLEATALMVLSLTESYVLSARVLGQADTDIWKQADDIAQFILRGIGALA
ncbi:TetR/AcrR family transcriptional regulator [Ktedonosporobacter rubrisoli]|uniref:TetR/AcrR family transcriptional regulator n=1 Tax=Ktedonosporobacter rubrisoli TaxID=2509675 RepID=A0A4P6JTT3_KTERU|nr:TetR/AcrR family transcriptional regulator [Ktedonosporobacter rubrisoli]QBD78692.1 TetR/AcrR family transcriptional regulator [Ktedonosporobacter rubrisoli]